MEKSIEVTGNDIAQRDAEAQYIIDLFTAGYAKTSGKVVKDVEEQLKELQKAHQADICRRFEAGEHVTATELLMDGYSKANKARKVNEENE